MGYQLDRVTTLRATPSLPPALLVVLLAAALFDSGCATVTSTSTSRVSSSLAEPVQVADDGVSIAHRVDLDADGESYRLVLEVTAIATCAQEEIGHYETTETHTVVKSRPARIVGGILVGVGLGGLAAGIGGLAGQSASCGVPGLEESKTYYSSSCSPGAPIALPFVVGLSGALVGGPLVGTAVADSQVGRSTSAVVERAERPEGLYSDHQTCNERPYEGVLTLVPMDGVGGLAETTQDGVGSFLLPRPTASSDLQWRLVVEGRRAESLDLTMTPFGAAVVAAKITSLMAAADYAGARLVLEGGGPAYGAEWTTTQSARIAVAEFDGCLELEGETGPCGEILADFRADLEEVNGSEWIDGAAKRLEDRLEYEVEALLAAGELTRSLAVLEASRGYLPESETTLRLAARVAETRFTDCVERKPLRNTCAVLFEEVAPHIDESLDPDWSRRALRQLRQTVDAEFTGLIAAGDFGTAEALFHGYSSLFGETWRVSNLERLREHRGNACATRLAVCRQDLRRVKEDAVYSALFDMGEHDCEFVCKVQTSSDWWSACVDSCVECRRDIVQCHEDGDLDWTPPVQETWRTGGAGSSPQPPGSVEDRVRCLRSKCIDCATASGLAVYGGDMDTCLSAFRSCMRGCGCTNDSGAASLEDACR